MVDAEGQIVLYNAIYNCWIDFNVSLGRIAAGEGRFNSNSEVNINTEVRSIPVTKKGIYFAFRDQGACISLLAVKVNHTQPVYLFQRFLVVCL